MYTRKIDFINQYDTFEQTIILEEVQSNDVDTYNLNFSNLNSLIYKNHIYDSLDGLEILHRMNNIIYASAIPYNEKLSKVFDNQDWNRISELFRTVTSIDPASIPSSRYLMNFYKNIRNGIIENPIYNHWNKLLNNNQGKKILTVTKDKHLKEFVNNKIIKIANESDYSKVYELYDVVLFLGNSNYIKGVNNIYIGKENYYIAHHFFDNYMNMRSLFGKKSIKHLWEYQSYEKFKLLSKL